MFISRKCWFCSILYLLKMVGPFSIWGMSLIKELETKIKGALETILQIVQAVVIDIYIFFITRDLLLKIAHTLDRGHRETKSVLNRKVLFCKLPFTVLTGRVISCLLHLWTTIPATVVKCVHGCNGGMSVKGEPTISWWDLRLTEGNACLLLQIWSRTQLESSRVPEVNLL